MSCAHQISFYSGSSSPNPVSQDPLCYPPPYSYSPCFISDFHTQRCLSLLLLQTRYLFLHQFFLIMSLPHPKALPISLSHPKFSVISIMLLSFSITLFSFLLAPCFFISFSCKGCVTNEISPLCLPTCFVLGKEKWSEGREGETLLIQTSKYLYILCSLNGMSSFSNSLNSYCTSNTNLSSVLSLLIHILRRYLCKIQY